MRVETLTRSELLEEVVACHRLGCGLEVCVYPKPGFAKKYALLATRYGSNDTRFRVNGEEAMTPAGIAHFLEHKLFEAEDGSIDDVFARQGAYSNAFTNYTTTAYLFSCTDGFETSLKTLVDFVFSPRFTYEGVEREKGIIEQEIRMNQDQPGWQVVSELIRSLFHFHPAREDVAGTVESVRSIDVETLRKCYNTLSPVQHDAVRHRRHLDAAGGGPGGARDGALPAWPRPVVERVRPDEPVTVARGSIQEDDGVKAAGLHGIQGSRRGLRR